MKKEGVTCDHCTKKDCEQCVTENGKNFCCENCCDDYKAHKEEPKKEPANVCKFC
ncbi:MAG: hypothetical protein AAB518_04190 [Patescibacteria group bacterium]